MAKNLQKKCLCYFIVIKVLFEAIIVITAFQSATYLLWREDIRGQGSDFKVTCLALLLYIYLVKKKKRELSREGSCICEFLSHRATLILLLFCFCKIYIVMITSSDILCNKLLFLQAQFLTTERHFVTFDDQFEYGARLPPLFLR